uniref:NADH dehydrogenase subunit 1 n=1 Tax=Panagrolaimus sp. JU765 TaxID=591449 RepID=A0AC34RIR2_9BILA
MMLYLTVLRLLGAFLWVRKFDRFPVFITLLIFCPPSIFHPSFFMFLPVDFVLKLLIFLFCDMSFYQIVPNFTFFISGILF